MLHTIELTKNWKEQKLKLKKKFDLLTDKDVFFIEGRQDDLIQRLQIKLGKTKEEVKNILSEL